MSWAKYPKESLIADSQTLPPSSDVTFAVQVVKQVNYGPLESKRYFVQIDNKFVEVAEEWLIEANFEKLNT